MIWANMSGSPDLGLSGHAGNDGLHSWAIRAADGECFVQKQLAPELAREAETATRWLDTAARNARLSHPACAQVVDWGRAGDDAFVVSRWDAALSLRTLLSSEEDGALAPDIAVYVGCALLEASAHAHTDGLAHLDLDPDGVLVRHDGSLRLPEFGLWGALPPRDVARRRLACARVHYVSPELVRGQSVDARSDVFSIGTMLCELLTGRRPFAGATQLVVALAIAEGRRARVAAQAPALPDALSEVLETMLATDAAARFQSSAAAHAALHSAAPWRERGRQRLSALVAQRLGADRAWDRTEVDPECVRRVRREYAHASPRRPGQGARPAPSSPNDESSRASILGDRPKRATPPPVRLRSPEAARPAALAPSPPPLVGGRAGVRVGDATCPDDPEGPLPDVPRLWEDALQPLPRELPAVGGNRAGSRPSFQDPSDTVFRRATISPVLPVDDAPPGSVRMGWALLCGGSILLIFYFSMQLWG